MNRNLIGLPALALGVALTGCADRTGSGPSLTAPEMIVPAARAVLTEVVGFYFGAAHGQNECANPATRDANGDYSFAAGGGTAVGGAACLTAHVETSKGALADGFVLWQICGDPAVTGRGTRAECESGAKQWVPRTGETWTALSNGEYTTASHTTLACNGSTSTIGYRYLFSSFDPTTRNVPPALMASSTPADVTSDGTVAPPGGCP